MFKDSRSGGVINTDRESLIKRKRDKMIERKIKQIQNHIGELKIALIDVNTRLDNLEQR